jgi:hypothetical protein
MGYKISGTKGNYQVIGREVVARAKGFRKGRQTCAIGY